MSTALEIVLPLIGGLAGGGLRLAPEILQYWTAKSEQAHELEMSKQYTKHLLALGPNAAKMDEAAPAFTAAGLEGLQERYISTATERAGRKYPLVNVFAALVRPTVTWWLVILYSLVRVSGLVAGRWDYGESDVGLLASVLSFWFVGRVWDRVK